MKRHIAKSFFEILMKLYETKPTIADKTAETINAVDRAVYDDDPDADCNRLDDAYVGNGR